MSTPFGVDFSVDISESTKVAWVMFKGVPTDILKVAAISGEIAKRLSKLGKWVVHG